MTQQNVPGDSKNLAVGGGQKSSGQLKQQHQQIEVDQELEDECMNNFRRMKSEDFIEQFLREGDEDNEDCSPDKKCYYADEKNAPSRFFNIFSQFFQKDHYIEKKELFNINNLQPQDKNVSHFFIIKNKKLLMKNANRKEKIRRKKIKKRQKIIGTFALN